ncbi:MAG: hypothetical protein NC350_04685 [Corallococcus sp.]|nr:hypothetical protein [Corallococcus sp.]
MKKKALSLIVSVVMIACLVTAVACTPNANITSIDITKDGYGVNELNVLVGDVITLAVKADDESAPAVHWQSSKTSVAEIADSGVMTVKGEGTTIITATLANDGRGISDSIFVNAKEKVEQTAVGSGKSADDPIFVGNEGKDEPIEVYFMEMHRIYSDTIFIKKGNVEILIDGGYPEDGQYTSQLLTEKVADRRLDVFMVSHSDGDHIEGIGAALAGIEDISLMIDYGGVGSGHVLATREKYTEKGMQYHSAYDCANQVGGATNRYYLTSELYVDVLNTGNYILNTEGEASNPHSLATIFTYKQFKFFTAGDLTTAAEKDLMKKESLPEVTLYKASHHGSGGSNSQELLDMLNPKAVAISAARASNYGEPWKGPLKNVTYNLNAASGHPHAETIERIYKAPNIAVNLNVYWNAVNGTMKFTSYGENNFTFEGSTAVKGYYDLTKTDGKGVWNETLKDFENRVTGEENFKLHQSKVFVFRDYIQYLPAWAKTEYFPDYASGTN